MPVVTTRADGTLQLGAASIVGPVGMSAHNALNDDNDVTYIEFAGGRPVVLDDEILKLSIQDFDVPDGAKIFAVRTRIRVQKIAGTPEDPKPPPPRPHCGFHRHGFLFELIEFIFRILFGFRCPTKPPPPNPTDPPLPPEWTTVELSYYTEQPGGGEWTEQTFDDFFVSLGRTDSETSVLRISELYVDLDYNEQPLVAVTGPVGPLVDITLPTVTWTYLDPESDKQQMYWVRCFENSVYEGVGFDPATSTAFDETLDGWWKGEDTFWTVSRDFPNGVYRAYVKTRQVWSGIGNHESEWAYWQWTQDVPGPPSPTLVATYEPDLNRVRLDLHEGGPSPATDTYDIEYSDNLAVSFQLVRNGAKVDIDDQRDSLVYDYEAPLNTTRIYRAAAYRVLNSILVTSGYSNYAEVTPQTDDWWLKDPVAPGLNCVVRVFADSPARPRSYGKFMPLVGSEADGRQARAVVVSGPRYGLQGTMSFVFIPDANGTETSWNKFNLLLDTGRTLLLQYITGEQHYIALADDLKWEWLPRYNHVYYRIATVSYVEVDPPTAGTGSVRKPPVIG